MRSLPRPGGMEARRRVFRKGPPLGGDILDIERTIQLAIAPAFPLSGIMAVPNILATRLSRPSC
ncbi:hypothetical protein SKB0092_27140 [Roseomonas mucosa]